MRSFQSLDQREILALAVALEEEHARIYEEFADGLKENFPEQATLMIAFLAHAPGSAYSVANARWARA